MGQAAGDEKRSWREMFLQFADSVEFCVMKLGESEKKQYKRWLARGELDSIRKSFGDEHYRSSLSYIAKK